jgi:hypothetical protein
MPRLQFVLWLSVAVLGIAGCARTVHEGPPQPPPEDFRAVSVPDGEMAAVRRDDSPYKRRMMREAEALQRLATSPAARAFLDATAELPPYVPRSAWRSERTREYLTDAAYGRLGAEQRTAWKRVDFDEETYWNTKYGSPLAYVRALDLLAAHGLAQFAGQRLLDYGYGTVGHLHLLAMLGAEAVGVDVDSMLPALYSRPGDVGMVRRGGRSGSVKLVHGKWPGQSEAARAVADGYDWIISKNTLKRGYVKPERGGRPQVDLGVPETEYLKAVARTLKPGGKLLIYNISPAQNPPDKPYLPHADGRSPFSRAAFEQAGLSVIALDRRDDDAVRAMGRALGWDKLTPALDLDKVFGLYTLVERR